MGWGKGGENEKHKGTSEYCSRAFPHMLTNAKATVADHWRSEKMSEQAGLSILVELGEALITKMAEHKCDIEDLGPILCGYIAYNVFDLQGHSKKLDKAVKEHEAVLIFEILSLDTELLTKYMTKISAKH